MRSYKLLIGADNRTKRLHKRKACRIVAKYSEGFSVYYTDGYWRGKSEKSMVVEVLGNGRQGRKMRNLAKELARELRQQAIGLSIHDVRADFIGA